MANESDGTYQPQTYREQGGAGTVHKAGARIVQEATAKAASFTLTAADSGNIFFITAADVVATLPATVNGLYYTFIIKTLSVTTGFSLSPVAADSINGGTDAADLINTPATDALGDAITIHGDGLTGWHTSAKIGAWAE